MKKFKAPPPVADINVTPMVDVMLVMLIIFMVITPMLSKGVSVDLVKAKNPIAMANAEKEDAIVVAITRDGKTFLGNDLDQARGPAAQGQGPDLRPPGQDLLREGGFAGQVLQGGRGGGQPAGGRGRPTRADDRSSRGEDSS